MEKSEVKTNEPEVLPESLPVAVAVESPESPESPESEQEALAVAQQDEYELKYKKFKTNSESFTAEKLSVFMNYWISDLLIDCFKKGQFNEEVVTSHVRRLLETHFFGDSHMTNDEEDKDDLITAFNSVFFEKIHKKLHFSKQQIKD